MRDTPAMRWGRVVLAGFIAFLTVWLTGSIPHSAVSAEVSHFQALMPPAITAKAVLVTDITSGTELFALDPDEALPPASLTKIVSALVILDTVNLDDVIEIVDQDRVDPEESQVGLIAGDRLSARDLLLGALVPSGNDATLALARHVGEASLGGTTTPEQAVAEFVRLMNAKAAALGAAASHFANPTGIDANGHVMSARDITVLTSAALRNPVFAEIVSTSHAVLHSEMLPDGYPITTTNQLLLEGTITGVKTGTTPKAGGCLVTSFAIGPNTIVAVVLGSQTSESADGLQDNSARFDDTRLLMNAVNTEFVWLDPATPGAIAGLLEELDVWNVGLGAEEFLPVPAADQTTVRYRLVLSPPAAPQLEAGEIQFYVGEDLLSARAALQLN